MDRLGRIIATLFGPLGDRIADRIADRLGAKLPDLSDLDEQILAKIPDLSDLDDQLIAKIPDLSRLPQQIADVLAALPHAALGSVTSTINDILNIGRDRR
jgi:hypothetical protein